MIKTLNHHFLSALLTVFIFSGCNVTPEENSSLPRSTPETENVSSQSIINFLDAVEASDVELHSFMYLRNGKVIAEGWWDPFSSDLKHMLYSTSKSFTSTAIGLAVSEGLLTVDDQVISFFPDELPDSISDNLESMRVSDLLSMTAGQDPEPTFRKFNRDGHWAAAFLEYPVKNEPGSIFLYNSAATYMLSAIITKVTGQTVLEYLTPRLFDPLEIVGMDWEADPDGISTGGWGLRLKTEDMAKFGQLYLQEGKWNGEQVLDPSWVKEATTMKILQSPEVDEENRAKSDWLQGYCYKFWRSRHNSYRADGAFGQFILVLPEKDVVIAITANARDMQKELNLVWDHLLPGMMDGPVEGLPGEGGSAAAETGKNAAEGEEDVTNGEEATSQIGKRIAGSEKASAGSIEEIQTLLKEKLENLSIQPPDPGSNDSLQQAIDGISLEAFHPVHPGKVQFNFHDGYCEALFSEEGGVSHKFKLGAGKWILGETMIPGRNLLQTSESNFEFLLPAKVACAYRWFEKDKMQCLVRYIEGPHTTVYTLRFEDGKAFMKVE